MTIFICEICGERLVDGYTVRITLDHPDDLDLDVHQFCCLAHAAEWLADTRLDPAYCNR